MFAGVLARNLVRGRPILDLRRKAAAFSNTGGGALVDMRGNRGGTTDANASTEQSASCAVAVQAFQVGERRGHGFSASPNRRSSLAERQRLRSLFASPGPPAGSCPSRKTLWKAWPVGSFRLDIGGLNHLSPFGDVVGKELVGR